MSAANVQLDYESVIAAGYSLSTATPLRFTTAGSVDDGKSTLIGRLLYDSQAVYEDQLASVKKSRINRSSGPIDFSLLTDGLRAEREQGITIDVAYRYFSTPRRKFIIADTPGHEQYTRNMATGASTADAAVVLVDASKGLLPQSRRHAYIANLVGIRHVIAAVNKMDLVNYSAEVFQRVQAEFQELADKLGIEDVYTIPISALEGENVVRRSQRMDWFTGPSLLEYLEDLPGDEGAAALAPVRFPIQLVIRPDANFRGFAGTLESGTLRPGDAVTALPSGIQTRVKSITTYDGEIDHARAGDAITVTLHDEVDISRGDVLVGSETRPTVSQNFQAKLVWMHPDALDRQKLYLLKHTTRTVRARVKAIHHRVDVNTLEHLETSTLNMNDIALADLHTTLPLVVDPYQHIAATGSFILIDPISNATVAAGMIADSGRKAAPVVTLTHSVTATERHHRYGHRAAAIWVSSNADVAERIERELFDEGSNVHLVKASRFDDRQLAAIARAFHDSGSLVVFSAEGTDPELQRHVAQVFGSSGFLPISTSHFDEASNEVRRHLREWQRTHDHDRGVQ